MHACNATGSLSDMAKIRYRKADYWSFVHQLQRRNVTLKGIIELKFVRNRAKSEIIFDILLIFERRISVEISCTSFYTRFSCHIMHLFQHQVLLWTSIRFSDTSVPLRWNTLTCRIIIFDVIGRYEFTWRAFKCAFDTWTLMRANRWWLCRKMEFSYHHHRCEYLFCASLHAMFPHRSANVIWRHRRDHLVRADEIFI